ncbi:MAG: glycoside hydrolase family 9 protein [Phycisphaerales bacterium]|nr:MAG: glycoside hydrolase family 9 protein [Phycisphaerales bacterium]
MTLVVAFHVTFPSSGWPAVTAAETEKINVAPNPSFENDLTGIETNVCVFGGWFPLGVVTEDGSSEIRIVEDLTRTGKRSLRVTPNSDTVEGTRYYSQYNGGEEVRKNVTRPGVRGARTLALRLDQDILSCDASAWVKKAPDQKVAVKAVWHTRQNRIPFIKMGEQAITEPTENKGGWYRYSLHAMRPHMARQVQITVETDGATPFHIDDVEIYFNRAPHADILVDQLGYETQSKAKGILLQSSVPLRRSPTSFSLVNLENQEKVFSGKWKELGYYRQWDLHHWEGDFSAFKTSGRYVVETAVDGDSCYSPPFEIADDLIVSKTSELAYRFFYYQRCGVAVPGFHAACHLDDARTEDGTHTDLAGGWHDAGDYNKYNGYTPESVYALVLAYDRRPDFFDQFDRDGNGRADILDEAAWGAAFLTKCLNPETLELVNAISSGYGYWGKPEDETDDRPGTGDERPIRPGQGNASACTAGFALLGRYVPEYLPLAKRLCQKYGGDMSTMLALYTATGEAAYREAAEERANKLLEHAGNSTAGFRELAEFARAFPDDSRVRAIRSVARRRLEEIELLCANRFGITRRRDDDGKLIFFRHYRDVNNWYVGESRELLDTAYEGVLLDALGFAEGRAIAENQVHWMLGRNPYGVSTMEGVGSIFVPQYHHRYNALPGNPRGAVPGAVLNGITRAWPDHDRPWLDMHPEPNADYQPNEPWLPHNNRWLFLVSIW